MILGVLGSFRAKSWNFSGHLGSWTWKILQVKSSKSPDASPGKIPWKILPISWIFLGGNLQRSWHILGIFFNWGSLEFHIVIDPL